jgi:16S rRNA C1402 N4-methylase RsmH
MFQCESAPAHEESKAVSALRSATAVHAPIIAGKAVTRKKRFAGGCVGGSQDAARLTKGPSRSRGAEESHQNPRSSSAKLRWVTRQ